MRTTSPTSITNHSFHTAYPFLMQAQRTEWVDAIRYFRGLGKPRRRRVETLLTSTALVVLGALTVLAAIAEFG